MCVVVYFFCIPAAIVHTEPLFAPSLCFNSSWWIAFPSHSRACLLYIWGKHSCILWQGARGEWTMLTTFLPMSVCLCWRATTVLVAWRRGDEGGLGKALQIRSNYSSPPPFALTGSLLPLLLQVTPVLFSLPSSLWGSLFLLIYELFVKIFFIFFSLPVNLSMLCLRWEPRPSRLVVSPSAITSLTVFFCSIIAHSSRWK